MPDLPLRQCPKPGCLHYINTYKPCPDHPGRANWETAPHKHKKLYGHRWREARARFLRENPLCVICGAAKRITGAIVVDHIKPHRGEMTLFWQRENWQALCKPCHAKKTAGGR